ncbi:putative recombination initiation defects 3 isoform X2 [Rosa chinensis]|uniref:putative recombination initiation defects 3 isoform X2 n=1 Tax=Rosa chinensis TaxID=74649 RepID=UPI000D08CBC1|nr:putative recombination initiation defects 3 isoform X2 [Rosa chinensis]
MKLKINKACDLSSISVLPPHNRRSNSVSHGPQGSQLQLRSQPSEQSFSQGLSSQYGMFSQLSQTSLDAFTDQRSQERENTVKKIARLPLISHAREESQMQISRPSNSLTRKWSSASGSDHRCQISEEFEHRIGIMETSLSKFGMILDSVQSDVMQVKKGTKEVSMEMEAVQQKLMVQDSLLQLMNKGQEDFKASLDAGIKSMSEQLSKNENQDKLQEMFLVLSTLPEKIEASILSSQNNLHSSFIKEMQKLLCSIQTCQNQIMYPIQTSKVLSVVSPKAPKAAAIPAIPQVEQKPKRTYVRKYVRKYKAQAPSLPSSKKLQGAACHSVPEKRTQPIKKEFERLKNPALDSHSTVPPKVSVQAAVVTTTETGGWKTVKAGKATSIDRVPQKAQKHNGITLVKQERGGRIIIESDEDIDGGFSFLLDEKETEDIKNYMIEEVDQETERILRRARRRKRRCCNPIIIN